MKDLTYMDCWHFIAPLIAPPSNDERATTIYVMVYGALKEADEREKEKKKNDRK